MTLSDKQPPEHDWRQRQEAQDNRANGDIANDPPLTKYQRRNKTEAERLFLVGNLIIALDENDIAAPGVLEPDRSMTATRHRRHWDPAAQRAHRLARRSRRSSTMLAPFLSVTIAGSAFFRWLSPSQVR